MTPQIGGSAHSTGVCGRATPATSTAHEGIFLMPDLRLSGPLTKNTTRPPRSKRKSVVTMTYRVCPNMAPEGTRHPDGRPAVTPPLVSPLDKRK
ncbi:hypothetical protein EVAR_30812_1, partial [Eumeta japonica]